MLKNIIMTREEWGNQKKNDKDHFPTRIRNQKMEK